MLKWITPFAVVTAAGAYLLTNEDNRRQMKAYYNRTKAKLLSKTKEQHTIYYKEKIGHSDPYDMGDNTMVDEGAVFGVNYYNKKIRN
ncbi:hypothetical protein J2S74_005461 [Evansella vedderi]|uniref:Uncharacterized protein n=1 Tax=Evansella vedderi TaxID=38282 RepID=A0ABU0A3D6_9BACI|nr:hypothetical protein [Evansella vedderi]MDQ0257998.1 hypothetical protein [Evansella vedderi]